MSHKRPAATTGFTLVELSIVMVIIAIIIGSVMVSTNLLRNARLRSIMVDKENYVSAMDEFKQRYKALPGDMANATEIWGEEQANFTDCAVLSTASTTKKTCNGDGDDSIAKVPEAIIMSGGYEIFHEYFRFWQHLANAGLIDGTYAGVNQCTDTTQACYKAGWNAPLSTLRNTTWAVFDLGAIDPLPSYLYSSVRYDHVMYFGQEHEWSHMPFGRVLSPKEQWSIDQKFDDGLPASGTIMSLEPVAVDTWNNRNACATTDVASTAEYNVSNTELECMLLFRLPL